MRGARMPQQYPDEGGFLLRFNDKEITRCYAVSLDYDNWKYTVNNTDTGDLPADVRSVTVVVEHPE